MKNNPSKRMLELNEIMKETDDLYRNLARKFKISDCMMWILYILREDDRVVTQSDIDDFLQEVFIRVYENIESFQGKSQFSTWITRIAYNAAINLKKRTKTSESLCEEKQSTLVSNYETPEETQLKKLTKDVINNAVKQLPENYEKCIELYFYNNMTYEEIAETTDIPLNTVKTYIFRAKKELYQKLKEII